MSVKMLFTRLLIGVVFVAALTVVEALPATAGAKGNKASEVAKGHTSQGRKVRVRVGGKGLKLLSFTAELNCKDGSELVVEESGFLWTKTSKGGSFKDFQFGKTDKVRFKGRVRSKAVKGRIQVSDRWGKVKCHSRWFKFTAKLKH